MDIRKGSLITMTGIGCGVALAVGLSAGGGAAAQPTTLNAGLVHEERPGPTRAPAQGWPCPRSFPMTTLTVMSNGSPYRVLSCAQPVPVTTSTTTVTQTVTVTDTAGPTTTPTSTSTSTSTTGTTSDTTSSSTSGTTESTTSTTTTTLTTTGAAVS